MVERAFLARTQRRPPWPQSARITRERLKGDADLCERHAHDPSCPLRRHARARGRVRAFPFGIPASVAATIMNANEWDAGMALMKGANPDEWALFAADGNLVSANRDTVAECLASAAKSKKAERCVITVQP